MILVHWLGGVVGPVAATQAKGDLAECVVGGLQAGTSGSFLRGGVCLTIDGLRALRSVVVEGGELEAAVGELFPCLVEVLLEVLDSGELACYLLFVMEASKKDYLAWGEGEGLTEIC